MRERMFNGFDAVEAWRQADPEAAARVFREGERAMPAFRLGLVRALRFHPVLQAYTSYRENGGLQNTAGWHAYGEWLMTILLLAGRAVLLDLPGAGGWLTVGGQDAEAPTRDQWTDDVLSSLLLSRPYLWRTSVIDLIKTAPEHPPVEITRELLPYPVMFWSYETGMGTIDGQSGHEMGTSDWMMLRHIPQGIMLYVHLETPERPYFVAAGSWKYGDHFPGDITNIPSRRAVNRVLSMLAFLNSPYVEATDQQVPRHFRRQTEQRASATPARMTVVSLRRATERAVRAYESASREWRHRWWVSGHFRQQPYGPGRHQVRTVWIAPYLKGPADMPVLEKVYDVKR